MTRIEIGIRPALLVACVVLLLVTVGAVSGLGYSGTQAALDQRLTHELEVTKKATTSEVKRLLEPAPKLVRQTEELILKDLISLEDYEHTANILVEHMASYPQIGWLGFAQPERYIGGSRARGIPLRAYVARPEFELGREWRYVDGVRQDLPPSDEEHYRPETGDWYNDSVASPGLRWSDPYQFSDGARGLSVLNGVVKSDEVIGVITADFFLSSLEQWLDEHRVGEDGRVLLVTNSGATVGAGHSDAIRALIAKTTTRTTSTFSHEHETYFLSWAELELDGGAAWHIAIVIPQRQLLGPAQEILKRSILLGVGVLLVGMLLAVWLAAVIARPFTAMSAELEQVANLSLEASPLPETSIREARLMASRIRQMRTGLRSFARYVPLDLVRLLLAKGEEATLGVESREMTLMFTDIVGFTSTTESTEPAILIHAGRVSRDGKPANPALWGYNT